MIHYKFHSVQKAPLHKRNVTTHPTDRTTKRNKLTYLFALQFNTLNYETPDYSTPSTVRLYCSHWVFQKPMDS